MVKDSSIYCHGNWSSIPQLRGGSLDACAAMVDTRERGNGWCNGSSFSLLWLGGGMDNKGMEKALVGPSWGRDMSTQIWITSDSSADALGQRGPFLGNCERK